MTTLWQDLFSGNGYALYVWAAVVGVLVFVLVELLLLQLRQRSILDHLGRYRHPGTAIDDIKTQKTDAHEQR